MSILNEVDLIKEIANKVISEETRGEYGQFFTPAPLAIFMASLFVRIDESVVLLDPGCGPCSLSAAFADECIRRNRTKSIDMDFYDLEDSIHSYINQSIRLIEDALRERGVKANSRFHCGDFIQSFSSGFLNSEDFFPVGEKTEKYTHIIMNPPYKKIQSSGNHRKWLRSAGIETVNLYSGFLSLALKRLCSGGELVAIIPRSFCNGPYYKSFREQLFQETAIQQIHIFDCRKDAFSDNQVLQENIIIHLIKDKKQGKVKITSSATADFKLDETSNSITVSNLTTRTVNFDSIVKLNDKEKFIHIASSSFDQRIIDRLSLFSCSLEDIDINVSTGPVVDFRMREHIKESFDRGLAPLIFPSHANEGTVKWPIQKKPNAISVSKETMSSLWANKGYYVVIKRLSSKEEKRRISAAIYDSSDFPGEYVGFDNKLNVIHINKSGLDYQLALGICVYLNCTLLDRFYRLFGGHTQVNATDLRSLHYPDVTSLRRIGNRAAKVELSQNLIDEIIETEIENMPGKDNSVNPLKAQQKLDEALEIVKLLGMPRAQQNERTALTLLAFLNLSPEKAWSDIERPMLGVTPIMNWSEKVYGKEYAPNTRETFRRQTIHQFVDASICVYNPDKPDRAVNSPKACYQISTEVYDVLQKYGTSEWSSSLEEWLSKKDTLVEQYAMNRDMSMIPLTLDDGTEIKLSPGDHSQLIHDIVVEFGPRFSPGSEVIYLGDTGAKEDFFRKERLAELGVTVDRKGKLPDVVLYWPSRNWLLLIESVTSHGPVDGKRHSELSKLFKNAKPGLVYVTAFPTRKIMSKYLPDISWETEVWVAEAPTHMIHFNGDRFLGPHN